MKNKFFILWFVWSLIGAALIFAVTSGESENTAMQIFAMVISTAPLLGLLLTLGSANAAQYFKTWVLNDRNSIYYLAGGIALFFAVPGILTLTFNPYTTTIFTVIIFAVFGALKRLNNSTFLLTWTDVALWILLWIPFDLRWSMELHPMVDYTWWSICISVVAVIGWSCYRNAEIGFILVPKIKDFYIALLALIVIMVAVIPPGIISGFLTFEIPETFDIKKSAAHFVGLFLTVALPEELFFRGILYRGLQNATSKKWLPFVVSSLAFGLMHWNNVSDLTMQITYVSLATIAGMGYAWAYKKSGNNLFAAILTHTLVDWVWKLVLAG